MDDPQQPAGLFDLELTGLDGAPLDGEALRGRAVLVVNVASKCGLTPAVRRRSSELQQALRATAASRSSASPATSSAARSRAAPEEIAEFCSTTYGTTFPMTEKLDVNGRAPPPAVRAPDRDARRRRRAGEVEWNFEKFLVSPAGEVVARFRPSVDPRRPGAHRGDRGPAAVTSERLTRPSAGRARRRRRRRSRWPRADRHPDRHRAARALGPDRVRRGLGRALAEAAPPRGRRGRGDPRRRRRAAEGGRAEAQPARWRAITTRWISFVPS